MTRPLAEFLLRVIWMVMDYLKPYVHEQYSEQWGDARAFMETVQFVDLPSDEQFG